MKIYMLVDLSGSMAGTMWSEATSSINSYVKGLDDPETKIILALFNTLEPFKIVRECRKKNWQPVLSTDFEPTSVTPLYDAMGSMMDIMDKECYDEEKAVFVVITDGDENSSKRVSLAEARSRVERIQNRGQKVVMLGAAYDKVGDLGNRTGFGHANTYFVRQGAMGATMSSLAASTQAYNLSADSRGFKFGLSEEERKAAAGEKTSS